MKNILLVAKVSKEGVTVQEVLREKGEAFLKIFYREIGCTNVDVVRADNGNIWVDDEGLYLAGNCGFEYDFGEGGVAQLFGNLVITKGVDGEGETILFSEDDRGLIEEWKKPLEGAVYLGHIEGELAS